MRNRASLFAALLMAPALLLFFPETALAKPITVPGFYGLRIPGGGVSRGGAPGGRGRIVVYSYKGVGKRGLANRVRKLLKKDGWTTVRETKSPRGTARLTVKRRGKTVFISVVGVARRSSIILRR